MDSAAHLLDIGESGLFEHWIYGKITRWLKQLFAEVGIMYTGRKNRMRKRVAWLLVLVMMMQVVGLIPVMSTEAVDELQEVSNIFQYTGSHKLYEGELVTITATSGKATDIVWSCTDTNGSCCSWTTTGENNKGLGFTLNALVGAEQGNEVTVRATNTNDKTYQEVTLSIYPNNQFYFVRGTQRVTTGRYYETDAKYKTYSYNLDVPVDGSIELKTSPSSELFFSTNATEHISYTTSQSDLTYNISNSSEEGQTPTTSASPVVITAKYEFDETEEDGRTYHHTINLSLKLHVVNTLTMAESQINMEKGVEGKDSTRTIVVTATDADAQITWKAYKGKVNPDSIRDAEEVPKSQFKVEEKSSTNYYHNALITITKDLEITKDNASREYTIIATQTVDNRDINAVCYVFVEQPVTSLSLSRKEVTMYLTGGSDEVVTTVTATPKGDNDVEPDSNNNTDRNHVIWSCTDDSVADIRTNDKSCTIYAKRPGHCVVVAASKYNPGASDVIYIEVVPKVSSVTITSTDMTVNLAEKYVQLFANVQSNAVDEQEDTDEYDTYLNALNKTVNWSSSNTSVATVDVYTGKVTLLSAGRVTITCASADDQKIADSIVLTINVPVASISLQDNYKKISVGESFTLNYTLLSNYPGYEPSNKEVTWESSDSKVATVDNDGKVTGVTGGTATILLRADDGQITATCTVEVYQAVSRIDISDTTLDINIGEEAVLEAQVYPSTASEQKVLWSSNKPDIVSVSQEGVVTANKVGDPVVITAYIVDKNATIKTTCIVNVVVPVTSLSLSPASKTLNKGETLLLTKNITPSDATNSTVIYASTDTGVATVDSKGNVTAVAGGHCYITARTQNRDMMASVYITVNEKVKSIKLNKTSKVMKKGSKYTLKATVKNSTATNRSVTWSSSNSKVASVTSKGVVTAKGYGTATITCKSMDGSGKKATCKITVRRYIKSLKLTPSSVVIQVKKTQTLKVTVSPSNADVKKFTWTSSNKKIATVKNGKITAVAPGTCYITCKAKDGSGKKVKCKVVVKRVLTDDDIVGKKQSSK